MNPCTHLPINLRPPTPSTLEGCSACIDEGRSDWVHLRLCQNCGFVGCCDSSPGRHATAHATADGAHSLIRSMEPGEDWWFCYEDELLFEIDGAPAAPSRLT